MIVSLLQWENPYIPAIEKITGEKVVVCRSRDEALPILPQAEIIITIGTGRPLLDDELLTICHRLRLVLSASAGVEKLPLQSLSKRGIAVCNTKGAQAVSIAEYVLGAMLAFSHRFPGFIRQQEKRSWHNLFGADLNEKTLCIIGTGHIGSKVAQYAKAFNMKTIGLRGTPQDMENFDFVWDNQSLHKALNQADFIVLATPLTPETEKLINAEQFCEMKPTSVLINISRGAVVDEAALINALHSGQIAGAVLDVFETEPLSASSPLWEMENVVITPHNAAFTETTDRKITELLCDNIKRFRQGLPYANQVQTEFY